MVKDRTEPGGGQELVAVRRGERAHAFLMKEIIN